MEYQKIGDGECDDLLLIPECLLDGGDCCKASKGCLENCIGGDPLMVGDMYCDDELNNEGCGYDGNDCCDPDADYIFCSECLCKKCLPDMPCRGEDINT